MTDLSAPMDPPWSEFTDPSQEFQTPGEKQVPHRETPVPSPGTDWTEPDLCAFLQLIQERKQGHAHHSVEEADYRGTRQVQRELLAEESARHHPVAELVKSVEEEAEQQADQAVVHVEA